MGTVVVLADENESFECRAESWVFDKDIACSKGLKRGSLCLRFCGDSGRRSEVTECVCEEPDHCEWKGAKPECFPLNKFYGDEESKLPSRSLGSNAPLYTTLYDETSPTSKKEQKKADRRQARKKAKGLILQTHSENPEINEQNEIPKMETQMDEMIQSAKKELEEGVGGGAGSKHDQRVAVRQEKRGKLREQ